MFPSSLQFWCLPSVWSGLASGCRFKRQRRESRPSLPTWYAILLDEASAAARGWPLAALGVSRLLVVKGLGYQEHVSEYGVHWNFFATLFCMRLIVAPMTRLRPRRMRLSLALLGVCVYQWLLLNGGLSDFIMHAPRDTIFAMNREGVLGIIGFVAIYYISEELGFQIRERSQKAEKVLWLRHLLVALPVDSIVCLTLQMESWCNEWRILQ